MSFAKTSALRTTAQALMEDDQVGVVTFGSKGAGDRVVLPMTYDRHRDRAHRHRAARARHRTPSCSAACSARTVAGRCPPRRQTRRRDLRRRVRRGAGLQALANRTCARAAHHAVGDRDRRQQRRPPSAAPPVADAHGRQSLAVQRARVPTFVSAQGHPFPRTRRPPSLARAWRRAARAPPNAAAEGEPPPSPPPPGPPAAHAADPARTRRAACRCARVSPPLLDPHRRRATGLPLGGAVAGEACFDARVLLVASDAGWPYSPSPTAGLAASARSPPRRQRRRRVSPGPASPPRLEVGAVLPAVAAATPPPAVASHTVTPAAPTPAAATALAALASALRRQCARARPLGGAGLRPQQSPVGAVAGLLALLLLAACNAPPWPGTGAIGAVPGALPPVFVRWCGQRCA